MKVRALISLAGFVATTLWSGFALARTSSDYPYPVDKVWNASVRLVRVDLGCPLGDRDTDSGYFMFEYVDGAHRYPGSLEIVRASVEGRDGVHVVVQIPAMPSYVERMILDRLRRKLVEDFGEPAPPPPQARPRERDDARDENARHTRENDEDEEEGRDEDATRQEDGETRERNRPARPNDD